MAHLAQQAVKQHGPSSLRREPLPRVSTSLDAQWPCWLKYSRPRRLRVRTPENFKFGKELKHLRNKKPRVPEHLCLYDYNVQYSYHI